MLRINRTLSPEDLGWGCGWWTVTIPRPTINTVSIVGRYQSRNECDQRNERKNGSQVLHGEKSEDVYTQGIQGANAME